MGACSLRLVRAIFRACWRRWARPLFLRSLAVIRGTGRVCLTELFFGKQPRSTPGSANMGILRRIVRII